MSDTLNQLISELLHLPRFNNIFFFELIKKIKIGKYYVACVSFGEYYSCDITYKKT